MSPKEITELKDAIRATHGCESLHVESVPVHEVFRGQTAWHGTVEVFDLLGHDRAKRAYAWQYEDGDETKSVAVLEIPPVDSPQSAVKVAIAAAAMPTNSKKPLTVTEFAQMGGFARARKLSKERQREIARNAGLASAEARRRAENEREA